jgi:hypothetical protein
MTFDEAYLARLRGGDDATAQHFNRYFLQASSACPLAQIQ